MFFCMTPKKYKHENPLRKKKQKSKFANEKIQTENQMFKIKMW